MSALEDAELAFGECPECGRGIERPFWDSICFVCQDQDEYDDDEWDDE
jgi:NMD protein affecting ribosome stability and mRNA decay